MRIYVLTSTEDSGIYIGQTIKPIQKRFLEHKRIAVLRKSTTNHLYNSMIKYGPETFGVTLIEECNSLDDLDCAEEFWIAYYKSIGAKLLNIRNGGRNQKGYRPSADAIRRQSAAMLGNTYGKALAGIPKSPKHIENVAIAHRKPILAIKNNQIIKFNSIKEASNSLGLKSHNISAVLTKQQNTSGGYWFKYDKK